MDISTPWDMWKKAFYSWENATANVTEAWLRSPMVLGPSGKLMTQMFKMKAKTDQTMADWWSNMGVPTRHDQERTLHLLNQLHSRINDLEEQLEDARAEATES